MPHFQDHLQTMAKLVVKTPGFFGYDERTGANPDAVHCGIRVEAYIILVMIPMSKIR